MFTAHSWKQLILKAFKSTIRYLQTALKARTTHCIVSLWVINDFLWQISGFLGLLWLVLFGIRPITIQHYPSEGPLQSETDDSWRVVEPQSVRHLGSHPHMSWWVSKLCFWWFFLNSAASHFCHKYFMFLSISTDLTQVISHQWANWRLQ